MAKTTLSLSLSLSLPRVVIVDDASQTRETFQVAYPGLDVVGSFSSVTALLAQKPPAEVVVLDLMLSTSLDERILQGPRAVKELSTQGYRVCVYTDERRPLVLARCFSAGACGLVRKSDRLSDNQAAFIRVAAGQIVVPRSMVGLAEILSRRKALPSLTPRQTEVLAARARGEAWDALSRRLGISSKTAQDHLEAVMSKMVLFLRETGLNPSASPADIERTLGLAPGDLDDPWGY